MFWGSCLLYSGPPRAQVRKRGRWLKSPQVKGSGARIFKETLGSPDSGWNWISSRLAPKQFHSLLQPLTCPIGLQVRDLDLLPIRVVYAAGSFLYFSFTYFPSFKVPTMCKGLGNPIPNGEQNCLSEGYSAVREMTVQGDSALGADSAQLYSHGHLGVTIY